MPQSDGSDLNSDGSSQFKILEEIGSDRVNMFYVFLDFFINFDWIVGHLILSWIILTFLKNRIKLGSNPDKLDRVLPPPLSYEP
jgi:hypothetical protein